MLSVIPVMKAGTVARCRIVASLVESSEHACSWIPPTTVSNKTDLTDHAWLFLCCPVHTPTVTLCCPRSHLHEFFPLLTVIISTEYTPAEVLRVLADLFAKRVGPILGVAQVCVEGVRGGTHDKKGVRKRGHSFAMHCASFWDCSQTIATWPLSFWNLFPTTPVPCLLLNRSIFAPF